MGARKEGDMTKVTAKHVRKRVSDWKRRLDALYAQVKEALAGCTDLSVDLRQQEVMHEHLMQTLGVGATEVPVMTIRREKTVIALLKPKGLWIVGGNGRVDLLTKDRPFLLVDRSSDDAKSDWYVFSPQNRTKGIPLNADFLRKAISSQ